MQRNTYLFRQIQYFDVVNGNPEAEDFEINASVFRKRDDLFVRSLRMQQKSKVLVDYTNPKCSNARLITRRIVYEGIVDLDPAQFSDPQGYYMVWERCCRNNIITNIVKPDQTGQTFYLEFPPIRKGGVPFINNTPQLFPPLSDYACVGRFYYADFRGTDIDGDSLVYSLVTPFNVHDPGQPLPLPQPLPIPPVTWSAGISDNYQVPGDPTLSVNPRGILSVTPAEEGLFVFSVKCEEFRDGVRIGEVRRDFQLFVIDCVPPGNKPSLIVREPEKEFYTENADTLKFKFEDSKCIEFKVADRDGGENLKIRAEPVNFNLDIGSILSDEKVTVNGEDDTVSFTVCLPDCPFLGDEPYILDVLALDGTCPQPQMDTIRLIVDSALPPNRPPKFTNPADGQLDLYYVEGETVRIDFSAADEDLDSLELFLEGFGFEPELYGITIDTLVNEGGKLDFRLTWELDCRKYQLSELNQFKLKLLVEDKDQCAQDQPDSVVLNIVVQLPENNRPVISIDGSTDPPPMDIRIDQAGAIEVRVDDADGSDSLFLKPVGVGFQLQQVGMTSTVVAGKSPLQTLFNWQIGCYDLDLDVVDSLNVMFIAEDGDYCKESNADTLEVTFHVLPPINDPPDLYIDGLESPEISVHTGDMIDHYLLGVDKNGDELQLRILEGNELLIAQDLEFQTVSGTGMVQSPFKWQINCELLNENYAPATYNFTFLLEDQQCINPMSDTLRISVVVSDIPANHDFLPPNVFTPNASDDINAFYYIPNLPVNNCESQFEKVVIVNRWGKEVFTSNEREFRWEGLDVTTGVYYYTLKFSDRYYRGTVSMIR